MNGSNVLLVFAKIPAPGDVKTRLGSVISEEDAARLYDAFLRDSVETYTSLDADVRLYLAPSGEPIPPGIVPEGVEVMEQRGSDLGKRMLNAFVESFASGYERVVVIGTDHPTLPVSFVAQAFDILTERFSVVIGPASDGGYYLLGMNGLYPVLFHDVVFSRADVFAETLARIEQTDANLTLLPEWYDVDVPADLERLVRELEEEGAPSAPRTREVLRELLERHPELQSSRSR